MTVDEILDPKLQSKRIAEDKAAADAYDNATGQNQFERDSSFLQISIRRRDMFMDALVGSMTPNDRVAYAEQVERLDALIEREQERLGL